MYNEKELADAWLDGYGEGLLHGATTNQRLATYIADQRKPDPAQDQIIRLQAEITQLRSQMIAREDQPETPKPTHNPLAELLKTHRQLGATEIVQAGDAMFLKISQPVADFMVGSSVGLQWVYRPIPTNIPLPEGAVIPDGYCALAKGEKVPAGAQYWVLVDANTYDWAPSRHVGFEQDYERYFIRPIEPTT